MSPGRQVLLPPDRWVAPVCGSAPTVGAAELERLVEVERAAARAPVLDRNAVGLKRLAVWAYRERDSIAAQMARYGTSGSRFKSDSSSDNNVAGPNQWLVWKSLAA